jgi:hypothetical protein
MVELRRGGSTPLDTKVERETTLGYEGGERTHPWIRKWRGDLPLDTKVEREPTLGCEGGREPTLGYIVEISTMAACTHDLICE